MQLAARAVRKSHGADVVLDGLSLAIEQLETALSRFDGAPTRVLTL